MIDFQAELARILKEDELGLLDVKPLASSVISSDDRLLASFEEINAFFEAQGKKPEESREINERSLFSRLKGLREHPEKLAALKPYDRHNLLGNIPVPAPPKPIEGIDDVLDDPLGLLGGNGPDLDEQGNIFDLKNVPKPKEVPDEIGKQVPCKDFERFEPLFKQCHLDLKTGKAEIYRFKSDKEVKKEHFFILNGLLVFVAEVGDKYRNKDGKFDARLRCIYENGTESDILLRSLVRALYKDEGGRRIVSMKEALFEKSGHVTEEDNSTGFVYVLKSLSSDPKVKAVQNLYKIGYSTQPTEKRILNAAKEPTYLMADVQVVAEFQTFNLNPQKLEHLLHRFFTEACVEFEVFDADGKKHFPREWFIAPLDVIEQAIQLMIDGDIVNYRFDAYRQIII